MTRKQKQVVYRRLAVFSLLVKGTTNTYEIAEALGHVLYNRIINQLQFLHSRTAAGLLAALFKNID
jgi:hypothetical protein